MDFKTLCTGCRTYRRFTQEKIAPEVLDELMDNVRIANSAMNGQVLRYVLVKDPDLVAKMQPMIHWAAASEGARHAEGRRTADGFRPHLQGRPRQSVG
jgi:FMN reductase [NAD(P)H]